MRATLALSLMALSGAALGRGPAQALPTAAFVADAEAFNFDLPSAETLTGGRHLIEFGSNGEVRNLACAWADDGSKAKCSYEYRINWMGKVSQWVTTTNEFSRDRKGQFLNNCRPSEARID